MNINEYGREKQALSDELIEALYWVFLAYLVPGITPARWAQFIRAIYPRVKATRDVATELARNFFDSQHAKHNPNDERVDFFKSDNYPIEWFEEALHPVFDHLQKLDQRDDPAPAVTDMSNRIVKVLEDGARRTTLNGVEADNKSLGWARFDPRPPTCAFCTMMISRGPVYKSARSGGSSLDDDSARELFESGDTDAMNALMNRWHAGCTCIVVPVYNYSNYDTESQERAAFDIYQRARRKAKNGSAKEILKAMRELLREANKSEEDETRLPR